MVVRCRKCNIILSNKLTKLENNGQLNETDQQDYIKQGYYYVSDGEFYTLSENKIIINKADLINASNHSNKSRLNGCCGLDGMDGLNKVCKNGHEIATEFSDCWMPHSVIFEPELITITEN